MGRNASLGAQSPAAVEASGPRDHVTRLRKEPGRLFLAQAPGGSTRGKTAGGQQGEGLRGGDQLARVCHLVLSVQTDRGALEVGTWDVRKGTWEHRREARGPGKGWQARGAESGAGHRTRACPRDEREPLRVRAQDKEDAEYTGAGGHEGSGAIFRRQASGNLLTEVMEAAGTLNKFVAAVLTKEDERQMPAADTHTSQRRGMKWHRKSEACQNRGSRNRSLCRLPRRLSPVSRDPGQ